MTARESAAARFALRAGQCAAFHAPARGDAGPAMTQTGFHALLGARVGLAATGAMSALLAARWLGQPAVSPPPQAVAENALRRLGLEPAGFPAPLRHATWTLAHAGFGATLGAVYGVVCWALNYGIALPFARIYPRPDRDNTLRAVDSALSHVVFGWALA